MYSGLLQGSGSDLRERVLVAGCVGRGRGGCSTKRVDHERNATGQHAACVGGRRGQISDFKDIHIEAGFPHGDIMEVGEKGIP